MGLCNPRLFLLYQAIGERRNGKGGGGRERERERERGREREGGRGGTTSWANNLMRVGHK